MLWIKEFLGISEDELFYINGPQTLPPPLSKEEETALLERLETDSEAKNILVEHNLRLVVYIAKKFENTAIGIEDLISIGTIGLIKAVNTFRAEKQIKLATYASRCIENEILMYIRKNTYLKTEMSLDEPLNIDYDGNELLLSDLLGTENDFVYKSIEESEDKKIIMRALNSLSARDRQIIKMRFGISEEGKTRKEKTQKEVADILGISQSYISRLEKRIIEKLKEYLTKQNY
ncbi:MAG: RNA polymerase sporulation sigma factor SigE [Eubacteriales bacterium]|nr:RNA polymerase sporulation sigma factor SigE [Eubacteriales bacterium]MDD4421681.1 RNA polymerase sporulation sigma factor SigE [Eubacteriales bacterium]